jgi:tetratricopeptide (TPR) repeat protein
MTQTHLTERTLGLYAIDPALIDAAEGTHLRACEECQQKLAALRSFDALLREPETWAGLIDDAPSEGQEEMRAFALRAAEEDAAAIVLLDDFKEPTAAARFAWRGIADQPEFQTGGVARLLCRWANAMCERDPLYALKFAEAATAISLALPGDSYPRRTIHNLRGQAQKEQANALRFLGRLPEAMRAVERAEEEYNNLPYEDLGLATVKYVRGCVQYEQDKLEDAEHAAVEAADAALQLGATDLYMKARHLLGSVCGDRHDYVTAAAIFGRLLRMAEEQGQAYWIARESQAVGLCYLELGRTEDASRYLQEALRRFRDLNLGPEVTRTRWSIARLLFIQGNGVDASYRLRQVIREFTEYEMLTDAAVVAVDLAEILHALGRTREVAKVLTSVVRTFMDAGKLTSALAALAHLKDAAAADRLTRPLLGYVRRFVQQAERQPDLLFAPPSLGPL